MIARPAVAPSWVPALPEIALAACLVGLATFTAVVADGDVVAGEVEPDSWWQWALVIGSGVPVAFRRVAPMIATPITIAAQLALWGLGIASAFFAPLVMIYTVCAEAGERGRRLGAASGISLGVMALIGVFVAPDVTADLLVFTMLASAMAYLLGTQTADARAAEIALAEKLATAQAERDMAQERAAFNERQRIARELHDIVGHSLSVIAVRAEAADRVAAKKPDEAADAVSAIAGIARSSLSDVRRVLAGLRDTDTDGDAADLAPLPSLGSIPGLVTSFADAGLDAQMAGDLPSDEAVGAAVGAGAYRIVQEALTNVLKHGGSDASAMVQIEMAGAVLTVQVEDTGRGMTTEASTNNGLGQTGMRERAEVLGGQLDVGPRTGGGYRVVATLPVDADVVAHG